MNPIFFGNINETKVSKAIKIQVKSYSESKIICKGQMKNEKMIFFCIQRWE